MWEFEDSIEIPATRERVWALYADVPGWPDWNPGVGRAELDGPLAEGTTGTIRGVAGPNSTLEILEVEPERRLVTQASERLMRVRFEQELADGAGGRLRITHRARMTGIATPLMKRTVGPRLERTIPAALAALAERATVAQPTSEPR